MDKGIKLIKKYSPLAQITEEKQAKFEDELYDVSTENKPSIKDLLSYGNVLKPELLNEKGSSGSSPGESAINEAFRHLSNVISEHYSNDESNLEHLKPLYKDLMNLITTAYEGNYVTSGNCDAIRTILQFDYYSDYIEKEVTVDDIRRLMRGICRDFKPRENDTTLTTWKNDVYYPLGEIIGCVKFEVLRKCKAEIIHGLLFWAETGMKYKEDDDSVEHFIQFTNLMSSVFETACNSMLDDEKGALLFMDIDDKTFDSFLSRADKILSNKDFPPNRYPEDNMQLLVQNCLTSFIQESNDSKMLGKVYGLYNKFASSSNGKAFDIVEDMKTTFQEKLSLIDFEAIGMKSALDQFLDDLRAIENENQVSLVRDKYEKSYAKEYLPKLKKDINKLKEFIQILIENPYYGICREYFDDHVTQKKLFTFKENPEILNFIFDLMYKSKYEYNERFKSAYDIIGQSCVQLLEKEKLLTKRKKDLLDILERCFEVPKHPYHSACSNLLYHVEWKGEIERYSRIVKKLRVHVEKENSYIEKDDVIVRITSQVTEYVNYHNGKNKKFIEYADSFADLFKYCVKLSWLYDSDDKIVNDRDLDEDERRTLAGTILIKLMTNIYEPNNDFNDFVQPIVETLKKLKKQDDDEQIQECAKNLVSELTDQMELLGDEAGEDIIEEFLNDREISQLDRIASMYPSCQVKIHESLEEILDIAEENGDVGMITLQTLLNKIADNDPKQITKKVFDYVMSILDTNFGTAYFFFLQKLAPKRPQLFDNYHTRINDLIRQGEHGNVFLQLLPDLSRTKELAQTNAKLTWEICQKNDPTYAISAYYTLRSIALRFKETVEEYKPQLEKLKDDPKLRDSIMSILDVLEGRTLETVANDVEEQREDIDNLDSRVTNNEDKIENLDNDVRETKEDVANVKQDVKETKERIDQIEYTIKGLDERVEELSHMTLSHAPAWTRHVSELMNDQTDHDWRLLAMKLNYTNDDIRNWATQPDPCLSMFDEWFATHKTREATNAILTNLKEMNRLDAAEIVESALANVKDVVQDDEDEEFEKPEVFLSYQWGHQQEVKLLRKHLEMAGFKAWMDIGQMGGGDKLYAKIDDGVRSAKVIISCVSEKYAKSANCCREVNLSTNLGKPMIPILMEQLSWPPAGPMGPIMSEYLYIRFFKSGGMEKGDSVFWLPAKFQELLMQVRYFVVPDMKLITNDSPYKGWMNPPEEEIIIPKREQKAIESSNGKSEENTEQEVSPDVFISYQWGKQPQIKRLYKKLSEMGYYCWLDIMQMGGGDSLFDKIDKGIRGAKVIISCVTPKYALSANCRREVSLSGALSKPIVPLLLEDMKWPPEGPMSMTFTELLYIGFHRKKDDKLWEGDEFNQLISKIDLNAPGCRMISEAAETKESSKTAKDDEEAARKRKLEEENKQKELEKENAKRIEEERRKEAEERKKLAEEKRKQEEESKRKQEEDRSKKDENKSAQPRAKKSSMCTLL
ncbi:DgyrCDS8668 [Dimorphilus gyrociliatus]|uniref:DgyrCDS8668 n=1 Tax=Dimorphilus gyrociliatus TaxID=2664684 RepID=A0A7I8VVV7_9ANNE|nr:DgyrCDS8668 [Dimorphilus gyrociliatus]